MARNTIEPSAALPYVAKWASANIDITSTTATTAPVLLGGLAGQKFLNLRFAGDSASKTFSWELCLWDKQLGVVVRVLEFDSTASARRSALAGAAGLYLHDDLILDISGAGAGGKEQQTWVLVLKGIDTDTGAYLMGYESAPLGER